MPCGELFDTQRFYKGLNHARACWHDWLLKVSIIDLQELSAKFREIDKKEDWPYGVGLAEYIDFIIATRKKAAFL